MPPRVAFVTIGPSPCTDVLPVIIAETRTCFAPIGFVPSGFAPTAALQRRSRGRRNTGPGAAMAAMAGPPQAGKRVDPTPRWARWLCAVL